MAEERQVWIVGEIEAGARAGDQRFHRSDCYVLDQVGNRDCAHRVPLAHLPDSFKPCQICAPASRHSLKEPARVGDPPVGIQIGHEVAIEDLDRGEPLAIRIVRDGGRPPDSFSATSPLGSALIGQVEGASVEVRTPSGKIRRYRVLRFEESIAHGGK